MPETAPLALIAWAMLDVPPRVPRSVTVYVTAPTEAVRTVAHSAMANSRTAIVGGNRCCTRAPDARSHGAARATASDGQAVRPRSVPAPSRLIRIVAMIALQPLSRIRHAEH